MEWDVCKIVEKYGSGKHKDNEGWSFSDPSFISTAISTIEEAVESEYGEMPDEFKYALRDIVLGIGEEWTEADLQYAKLIVYVIGEVLTHRYFVKND